MRNMPRDTVSEMVLIAGASGHLTLDVHDAGIIAGHGDAIGVTPPAEPGSELVPCRKLLVGEPGRPRRALHDVEAEIRCLVA